MWSIFGTTGECVTGPEGGLAKKSKKSVYSNGAWCGFCLRVGMRTWINSDKKICCKCGKKVPKKMRIID